MGVGSCAYPALSDIIARAARIGERLNFGTVLVLPAVLAASFPLLANP